MMNDEEIAVAGGGTAKGAEWKFQGMTFYRVAQGDTLNDIARRFNTSSETIKALNSFPRRRLMIPAAGCGGEFQSPTTHEREISNSHEKHCCCTAGMRPAALPDTVLRCKGRECPA